MDADTVVRYKNDSCEWIFKDNDLCKTKETSKSFKDADQSEYESNVEIFSEITIQFNNEVHLLYDGPVQIKCSRRSQDYSFNCSNVINKSSEVTVTKIPGIARKSKANQCGNRSPKKDSYTKTVIEKQTSLTKPSVHSSLHKPTQNSGTKCVKSTPPKLNKNIIKSDALCTKTKLTASDDVCSRTSQVFIPRRTNSVNQSSTIKSSTTIVPIKNTNTVSNLHSTNTTAIATVNNVTKESSITKNIRATFNKLLQSNANSVQATIDDIKITNAHLNKRDSAVNVNLKNNLTNAEADEKIISVIQNNQIDTNTRKSNLHEKILHGRSKTDKIKDIISKETISNQKIDKFGKELRNDCKSTPIKNSIVIQDDVILIEEAKTVKENVVRNPTESSNKNEVVKSTEKLDSAEKSSINLPIRNKVTKNASNKKIGETQISSECLANKSKIDLSNSDKVSEPKKKTTDEKDSKSQENLLLNNLTVNKNTNTQDLNVSSTTSLHSSSTTIIENENKSQKDDPKIITEVENLVAKDSTENVNESNSEIETVPTPISPDKEKEKERDNTILKNTLNENPETTLETDINVSVKENIEIVNNTKFVKNNIEINDPEKSEENLSKSRKNTKGRKRKPGGIKNAISSPISNSDINKSGVQKKLTQYFTKKSIDANELLNDETENSKVDKIDENTETHEKLVENSVSSSSNTEKSQNVNNECLRNISISILEENQKADRNKTQAENNLNDKSKPNPENTIAALVEENLEVIQKENIPATTNEAKSKDLTTIDEVSTNITKARLIKGRLKSKLKSTGRRITRSKHSSKLVIKKPANRKSGSNKNNSFETENVIENNKNENVNETIPENVKSLNTNKTTSIKRESKPDETENIIRLETIGTEIHTFHCKKCDKIFLRKSLLLKHEKETHPSKKIEKTIKRVRKIRRKYDCGKCSESFLNARALKLHKCSEEESNVQVNENENNTVVQENNSAPQNEVSITEEPVAKRICLENSELKIEEISTEIKSETESSTENAKTKKKIDKSINKSFVCPHCNVNMLSTNDLKVHVKRVHEKVKSKICPYCSRGFTCTGDLTRHIRLHTGEKPFKCTQKGCKMAFIASGDLIKHERTHLGDQYPRNFGCDICGKSFKQRYEHDRHIRTAHTSATKQFECHLCKKQFGRKDGLMYHLRLHAGIKPYTCKTCGKQFTDSGNLKKHMNTRRHELPPKKKRNRQKKTIEETDKQ